MGHRHLYNTSQVFDSEDQNWSHIHVDPPYPNSARAGPSENGSFFYPVENMSVDGVQYSTHWNPPPISNGYISPNHGVEVTQYQPSASVPSHDPFLNAPAAGTFCTVPENYVHHASSSSNNDRRTFHGIEGGFVDLTMVNGRGHHKRKSPGISSVCERGSTSRYHGAGSSSDLPASAELRQEKPTLDPQYMSWEHRTMTPNYRGNLLIRAEGSTRNVRSRPALDLEPNLMGPHLPSNASHNPYPTSHPMDHPNLVDFSDSGGFSHDANHFLTGNNVNHSSADVRGFHHDFISSRNPVVPQSFHGPSTNMARGVRSSYSHRSGPVFRSSSSNLRLGHAAPSEDGLQLAAESYPSRQPRQLPMPWHNGDRNERPRMPYERYQSLTNGVGLHDRFTSEGFMVVDRSALYGSRNVLDQHREMRLDIDNMSYEELLALGERIGNVNTGLSEDQISKCLTESIYCSSDQAQDEVNCVICLEEYKDSDDVGTLRSCNHDYHVSCIKKWLSMKNLCPICKSSALPENKDE